MNTVFLIKLQTNRFVFSNPSRPGDKIRITKDKDESWWVVRYLCIEIRRLLLDDIKDLVFFVLPSVQLVDDIESSQNKKSHSNFRSFECRLYNMHRDNCRSFIKVALRKL